MNAFPYRPLWTITALLVLGALALPEAQSPHAEANAKSRAVLQSLVDAGRTPGVAAAVAIDGRIVWTDGAGVANLEWHVPATAETLFGIGSISKSLTVTAMARLADRGAIDLDAPLERYLPDFPHAGRGVTLRRIAVHQSGLSDQFATDHYETTRHFPTVAAAYDAMRGAALDYTPGTKSVYATGVFTFLGRVLERATGKPYLDVMRDEVFGPLGLQFVSNDRLAIIPNRTAFYANREGGGFQHGAYTDPSHKLPGAGFLGRARDIAAFGAALLDPAFLSDRMRRELFTAVPLADGTATEFAPGFRVGSDDAGPVIHLPGGGIGISSWIFIHPQERLVVALVGNVNTAPVGGRAYREILAAFRAGKRQP